MNNQNAILLLDDDQFQIELACQACEQCTPELQLIIVKESADAMELFSQRIKANTPLPKLVLMNLKLPQLLGLAVVRRLRMHESTFAMPIIVYSARYEPRDVLLGYQAGATRFVNRPDNIDQFNTLLHDLSEYWRIVNRR